VSEAETAALNEIAAALGIASPSAA
jgi:hypothetical protein